jgi:TRAP-type C4-dicarboxylate transport system permease small subunit
MLRSIDAVSDFCGKLAAWLFFIIGGMISYEVVARYVFTAPTIWAEELSRFFQVWAVYLAAAYTLRHKHLIRITLLIDRLGDTGRRIAEFITLSWLAIFSAIAIWWGIEILIESIIQGRSSGSMLDAPHWMTESAVPLGFILLFLQCLAEMIRVVRGETVDTGRIEEQL